MMGIRKTYFGGSTHCYFDAWKKRLVCDGCGTSEPVKKSTLKKYEKMALAFYRAHRDHESGEKRPDYA